MVAQVRREWPGAVELEVTTGDGPLRALAYPALTGRPQAGDQVLLNANAVELGLGTGGYALVIAVPDRLPRPARPGPSGEGAVHPDAGLRPGGRRAGIAAPRGAPRRRRPGRHARRRGGPALGAAGDPRRAARIPRCPAGHRVRDAGRRHAARLVLQVRGGAAGGRVARGHDQHRAVVRRRSGDRHRAHRPAGGAACAGRRRGRGDAGTGQPGHRHPLGVLRRGLRRGGERGRGARRPPGGVPADQRGRRQAAPPGHLAPQPHRLRPGGPGRRRRGGAGARRRVRRRGGGPGAAAGPAAPPGPACRPAGWTAPWRRARCRWPRWAAAWPRTAPTSWPRPRPGGTPQPAG